MCFNSTMAVNIILTINNANPVALILLLGDLELKHPPPLLFWTKMLQCFCFA